MNQTIPLAGPAEASFETCGITQERQTDFDFIVCGAGSSGSVVAARLAEDGNARVLLLEAGSDDLHENVLDPARWPLNLGTERDWGFVGEPTAVDARTAEEMLGAGVIPVITPLGVGADGQLHNVNADSAAAALAKALRARKLAFISDVPGLLRDINDPGSLVSSLAVGQIDVLRRDGIIGGGMLPKLDSCAEAIRAGVGKVHLIDGRMPHSLLLEMFTKKGVGTEIIADE